MTGKRNGKRDEGCDTPNTSCDTDPGAVIDSCDATIPPTTGPGSDSKYFILEANLICDGTTNGITITGTNVILDCQGYDILNVGPSSTNDAIEITQATNTVVTNCGVRIVSFLHGRNSLLVFHHSCTHPFLAFPLLAGEWMVKWH
jgi:hypothetical protein